MTAPDTPRDGDAERLISPLDWRVLLEQLRVFGRSPDGSLERDLAAVVEREFAARDAALLEEQYRAVAAETALREARADECSRIVAWLRRQALFYGEPFLKDAADAIELGDHERGDAG